MFGPMTFAHDAILTLPAGLIGIPGKKSFGLGDMPDPSYGNFKLMQCIEQPDLAFLVLPIEFLPDRIGAADINEALNALSVPPEQAALLLIVTARKNDGQRHADRQSAGACRGQPQGARGPAICHAEQRLRNPPRPLRPV